MKVGGTDGWQDTIPASSSSSGYLKRLLEDTEGTSFFVCFIGNVKTRELRFPRLLSVL